MRAIAISFVLTYQLTAQCPLPDTLLQLNAARLGDRVLTGRLREGTELKQSSVSVSSILQTNEEKTRVPIQVRSVLVDSQWNDVQIVLAGALKAGQIEVNVGACTFATTSVPDVPDDQRSIDWLTALPLREGFTKITGSAGDAVKSVRLLVFTPTQVTSRTVAKDPTNDNTGTSAPKTQPLTQTSDKSTGAGAPPNAGRQIANQPDLTTIGSLVDVTFQNARELLKPINHQTPPRVSRGEDPLQRKDFIKALTEADCAGGALQQNIVVAVDKGRFEAVFPEPLDEGQCVFAVPIQDGQATIEKRQFSVVQPLVKDWGRVALTFFGGVTVGQAGDSDLEAAAYLSLQSDAAILNHLISRRLDGELCKFGISLNFWAEGRLSQAPDGLKGVDTLQSLASGASIKQAQSQLVQFAMYLPTRFKGLEWRSDGALNSFFVAPIAKSGVLWVKDGVRTAIQTTTESPVVVQGRTFRIDPINDETLSKNAQLFYGVGTRLGFTRYRFLNNQISNRQLRHDPLGFIDIVYGQHRAFRTPFTIFRRTEMIDTTSQRTRTVLSVGTRVEPRLMVDARIKLPGIPAFIGAEYNGNWFAPDQAISEFRVNFGFRIDAVRAINRAFGLKAK